MQTTNYKLQTTNNSGFTIIETLVALSIFTTSILAIFAVVPPGLSGVNYVKNKLTASYLAEEAIDLVRAYRDNGNLLSDLASTYPTGLMISIDDFSNIILSPCTDDDNNDEPECLSLSYTDTDGFFYQTSLSNKSIFNRTVIIKPSITDPTNEFLVSTNVLWLQGDQKKLVEYSTILTNWQ